MQAEKMLSLKQVQEFMGVSESTLYRLKKRQAPPFDKAVKLSRRVLIPLSEFNRWARSEATQVCEENNADS